MKFLLIVSCSGKKNKTKKKIPAIKRYEGVYYKVINKLKRENKFPSNLDVIIISAKYGFLKQNDLIENYDLKMNKKQARKLNKSIVRDLRNYTRDKKYKEIFINLGKDYMLSIEGFEQFIPKETKIIVANGAIGKKMKQMKEWILRLG